MKFFARVANRLAGTGGGIRRKLVVTNALAFGAATILVTSGILAGEYQTSKDVMAEDMVAQASILGSNVTASLSFKDPKSANETLLALRNSRSVRAAAVYDKAGDLFASYTSTLSPEDATVKPVPHGDPNIGSPRFADDGLELSQPILLDGERIGTIYLRSDLGRLYTRLAVGALLAFLISAAALALASLLLYRLQDAITGPIFRLLEIMAKVSRERNYSLRATVEGQDEVGNLAKGFNDMITQVQTRDGELEYHRKNLEAQVAGRTKDLEHALQAEKRFLASMSHELRTPLNAIIGFGDLLVTTELNGEQRRFSENVSQSARHMLSLVNDILDASKIEAGQMDLRDTNEFNLPKLLTDCMTIASSRGEADVHAEVKLPEPPFNLIGDDTRIKQVFINLLSNAFKFTRKGKVILAIDEVKEAVDGSALVRVSVTDTGVGIEEARMLELFQPFKQVHDGDFAGTGMGLFISRALARCMRGDIEVTSAKGQGTRFSVTLRLMKGSKRQLAQRKEGAPDEAAIARNKALCANLSILIVEDVDLNVELALQIFNRHFGVIPDVARNGLEAIDRVMAVEYDLIFMDLQMPKMGGLEAARKIREMGVKTPIVAMTANALQADVDAAKAAGMNDYITKPIQYSLLEKALLSVASASSRGKQAS